LSVSFSNKGTRKARRIREATKEESLTRHSAQHPHSKRYCCHCMPQPMYSYKTVNVIPLYMPIILAGRFAMA
jgi:hypothetical protein